MKQAFHLFSLMLCLLLGSTALWAQTDAVEITSAQPTATQNFDSMYDTASGEATLTLPNGWRMHRELNSPRTVGAWTDASAELMYTGGENLASNAKNGTWNWGASADPTDRAVGGLSTTVSGGTRCVSVMTALRNADSKAIESLTLSYDIEKYRKGDNDAGFDVQLYYSTDGATWNSAGNDFKTHFDKDDETLGAATVPISTTSVEGKNLLLAVGSGATVYLAWNITVASGSSPNKAMGLALDNVSITATYQGDTPKCYLYVEDVTKWAALYLNTGSGNTAPTGSTVVNGVNYKYFQLAADGASLALTFTDGGSNSVGGTTIAANKDYYFCLTASELTAIADPDSYTGWIDPSRPPFVSSGIYLRGEVNSWAASSEWEFSDEGSGRYVLYDKTLSGTFKVADASWSSACNYGTNGASILLDQPYTLVSGTNDNISCGGMTFACPRIILNISGGAATLLLESDDDASSLTEVYVVGDNNSWNYMDATGKLSLTSEPGIFEGQVTLPASSDGQSHWRIYQKLGMGGVWGNQGGSDATTSATSGTLEKGSTGKLQTAPGTYDIRFNLSSGEYTLTEKAAAAVELKFQPAEVVLVPQVPDQVKVLSLNNSLIYYHDQDAVFNDLAAAMGKTAQWTKHTLLGKTLNAHWNEGDGLASDGTKGAKMMVRSDAWTHIILQEQSSLPRTDVETFRANVKKWVGYIRQYCPNPNAVIIVPINWAYAGDWGNYTAFNATFVKNYLDVARDLGVQLCPVGLAYEDVYEREGSTVALQWFEDDRHPTLRATYMAACLEYATIYGVDPSTITWGPADLSAATAETMRQYASRAYAGFENVVDHPKGIVRYTAQLLDQYGLPVGDGSDINVATTGGGTIDSEKVFTASGEEGVYTLTASGSSFSQTAQLTVTSAVTSFEAYKYIELNKQTTAATEDFNSMDTDGEAALPDAWRIDWQPVARTLGTYAAADTKTMYSGGVSLASNAKNGTWNFGASDDSSDRAIGGITTGVADATRTVNVYTHLVNTGRRNLQNLQVAYDIEKYREGKNANGFEVQLYYSVDGFNWTSAGNQFYSFFDADDATAGAEDVPISTRSVASTLGTELPAGGELFLAWSISVSSGDSGANAMALAIDNFSIATEVEPIPTAAHYIYVDDQTGYDALGLYAWGDSELFGTWPGESWVDEQDINGVTYKVFLLDATSGSFHLIFNNWNNGLQLPDYDITATRDYYFRLSATAATEVDPNSTGISTLGNQTSSFVYTAGRLLSDGAIRVYSMSGELLLSGYQTVDLGALPRGIYIARSHKGETLKILH